MLTNIVKSPAHDCYILKIQHLFCAKRIELIREKRMARMFAVAWLKNHA